MLREIHPISQNDHPLTRRWYQCEQMDLFIWFDPAGAIRMFQLSYTLSNTEQCFSWEAGRHARHDAVDDGAGDHTHHPKAPTLTSCALVDHDRLLAQFRRYAAALDRETTEFISACIARSP